MQHKSVRANFPVAVLVMIGALAAWPYLRGGGHSSSTDPGNRAKAVDRGYSTSLKQLRERFNQDRGKVRMLLLLSPT